MAEFSHLKAGDTVIVREGFHNSRARLCKVDKITPTGLICTDGQKFYPDGRVRGGYFDRLVEATPEMVGIAIKAMEDAQKAEYEHSTINKAVYMMKGFNNQTLSFERAKAIIAILEGEKSNG